jgi:DNA-binding NarL/FixJ family response regulator
MVVDDEMLVRSGFRLILESAGDIQVVADCDGADAVVEAELHHPEVVLLDIRMPTVDGLTILRQLRGWRSPPVVAMLTTFDADEHVASALRCGAAGFLLKDTEPEQLLHSVRVLASGGSVLSPAVTRTVIGGYLGAGTDPETAARVSGMTDREREVLALIGAGLSNADIGKRLYLSMATVKDYVSAVLTKLGVANRVQAAVIAHQTGLATGDPG